MLKDISIFREVRDEDLKPLEDSLVVEKIRRKQTIFNEGDRAQFFYVLLKGKVKISKVTKDGMEIILEIIDEGDFFGALALIKGISYPASAVAIEQSEVGKIPAKTFLSLIKKYPYLEAQILHHVIMRLKSGIESLKNIATHDVSSRIAYQLLKLASKYGKNTPQGVLIDLRVTKQQLAELTGTTTETAIRVISKFKKLGYLDEINHKILIKDIKAFSFLHDV